MGLEMSGSYNQSVWLPVEDFLPAKRCYAFNELPPLIFNEHIFILAIRKAGKVG